MLREDATHGYNLLDALRQFVFAPGTVDGSVVYRILCEMEDGGWVSSQWDTTGSGPPRRVYTVTADGEEYLAVWISERSAQYTRRDRPVHRDLHAAGKRAKARLAAHWSRRLRYGIVPSQNCA